MKYVRRYKRTRVQGAILLEVLVAVVVLTIGLTAVVQAMMSHYRSAVLAQEYYQASQVLGDSLAAQMIASSDKDKVPEGDCLQDSGRYGCEVSPQDVVPSPDPELAFDYARITVSWPSGKGERVIEVPLYWARGRE